MESYEEFWVIFNNGSQDWVSPVVSVEETETQFIINNGVYDYTYDKSVIKSHQIVEIVK